jgi:hypothetical protein
MSLTKPSLVGNNFIIPGIPDQGEFGYSDIPAGDEKIANLFYSVERDYQCQSRKSSGFDPSIVRHSGV